ncbi:MAG: hypothetical protein ACE3L7_25530 [Candidatus Pristimantibacillus sp.]
MAQVTQAPSRLEAPPDTNDVGVLRNYVEQLANIVAAQAKDMEFLSTTVSRLERQIKALTPLTP